MTGFRTYYKFSLLLVIAVIVSCTYSNLAPQLILSRGSVIWGTVTNEASQPVVGAAIEMCSAMTFPFTTFSDSSGIFQFFLLTPEEVTLKVESTKYWTPPLYDTLHVKRGDTVTVQFIFPTNRRKPRVLSIDSLTTLVQTSAADSFRAYCPVNFERLGLLDSVATLSIANSLIDQGYGDQYWNELLGLVRQFTFPTIAQWLLAYFATMPIPGQTANGEPVQIQYNWNYVQEFLTVFQRYHLDGSQEVVLRKYHEWVALWVRRTIYGS